MKRIAAFLAAIVAVLAISGCSGIPAAGLITAASYPETAKNIVNDDTGYNEFAAVTAPVFLANDADNKIYCPANMYLSLGATAEITDGNTRAQILDVLGVRDMKTLRERAYWLGYSEYSDSDTHKCILSGAVWLNDDIMYDRETLQQLADNYFFSSYSGKCGSPEYDRVFRDWLNAQTDGLLHNSVSNERIAPETVAAVSTTVNFADRWKDRYRKTEKLTFYKPDGSTVCDCLPGGGQMMYYWGEKFSCIPIRFENNGEMRFILPDEGISPEELLNDEETAALLAASSLTDLKNKRKMQVSYRIPKFDITYDIELKEGMEALGITDVFGTDTSDFSPLTAGYEDDVVLSSAKQASRVTVDENGCKAASYQQIYVSGAAPLPEELERINIVFNRPFIFEIVSKAGHPLFIGIVGDPGE